MKEVVGRKNLIGKNLEWSKLQLPLQFWELVSLSCYDLDEASWCDGEVPPTLRFGG